MKVKGSRSLLCVYLFFPINFCLRKSWFFYLFYLFIYSTYIYFIFGNVASIPLWKHLWRSATLSRTIKPGAVI